MLDVNPKTLSPREYEHYCIRHGDDLPEYIPAENLWLDGYLEDAAGDTWAFIDTSSVWGAEPCAVQLQIEGQTIKAALRANLVGLIPPRGRDGDQPVQQIIGWFKERDLERPTNWHGYGFKLPFKPNQLIFVDTI